MTKDMKLLIAFCFAALVCGGVYWLFSSQPSTISEISNSRQANAINSISLTSGSLAPDFSLKTLSGNTRNLASFYGSGHVLGFFCGCDRCRAAAKEISKLQAQGKFSNFVAVLALDRQDAFEFCRTTRLKGTVLIDPNDSIAIKYNSEFCPRFWYLSDKGKIIYGSLPALEGTQLRTCINTILLYGDAFSTR